MLDEETFAAPVAGPVEREAGAMMTGGTIATD
jgi:hypothetical protein